MYLREEEGERRTRSSYLIGFLAGNARLLYLDYDHVSISIDKKRGYTVSSLLLQPSAVLHCASQKRITRVVD